jgi:hypothetical protein
VSLVCAMKWNKDDARVGVSQERELRNSSAYIPYHGEGLEVGEDEDGEDEQGNIDPRRGHGPGVVPQKISRFVVHVASRMEIGCQGNDLQTAQPRWAGRTLRVARLSASI